MALLNHFKELSITDTVYNRIVFLSQTDANAAVISTLILEVMSELDYCFNIDAEIADGATTNLGDENAYSLPQRLIIADVVSVYLLQKRILKESGGTATDTEDGSSTLRFLSGTVAGSVEAEWEQIDSSKSSFLITANELLDLYRDGSRMKMDRLGCTLAWNDEQMQADADKTRIMPFIVVPFNSCK